MRSEPPPGLSSILEICLIDQSDHKIINGSHHFASVANRHTRGIFLERYIPSVVQSCFNPPMFATKTQQVVGCDFFAGQTCNAKFHFTRCSVTASTAPPLELSFEAIDLSQTRPSRIGVEHFTGGQSSFFKTPVSFVDFLNG